MTSELFSDCPRAKLHLSLHFVNALHLSRDYMNVLTFHFNFLIYLQTMLSQGKLIFSSSMKGWARSKHYVFLFLKKGVSMTRMKEDLDKTLLKSFKTVLTVNFALQLYIWYTICKLCYYPNADLSNSSPPVTSSSTMKNCVGVS